MVRTKNTARIMRAIEEKKAQNVTDNSDMVSRDPVMNEDSQTAVDVHPIASAQDTSVLDDIDTVDSKVHATAEEEEKKEVQDSIYGKNRKKCEKYVKKYQEDSFTVLSISETTNVRIRNESIVKMKRHFGKPPAELTLVPQDMK
ncbi:hypothetical protein PC119_g18930 [Phytophthora cactorum]|uniref:Uncharacterized protein n=2 Tax=Phytophthora cactorum TaxID=29920 RepID=A0A8T1ASY1_9STRA|nr:hypothetical protein PC115_g22717 [Phytophthora cactorum]KAG2886763.1 hypothetical protein PC117_g25308 [Phytophthora cactorum]KAG2991261.1 hypothetical protein PC119_g18930 [Phytophthora cactorum]